MLFNLYRISETIPPTEEGAFISLKKEEGEIQADQNTVDTEEDNVIKRGNNIPMVHLSKYHNTEGKEAQYKQKIL